MKKIIIISILLGLFTYMQGSAQENFKVMFYNLLNYPDETAVPNREDDLEVILGDYLPDLFLVCELNNITGANNILNITRMAIDSNYEMATYVSNTSDDNGSNQNILQNLLYYNSDKFILEEETIVPTDLRDFNVYKLKVNSVDQDTNPVELYVIVCHLKASSGPINEQRRFNMVVELIQYFNTLPSNSNVLLGGDLNVYRANEDAFQLLVLDNNSITLADPANRIGDWSNNPNFVDVFTQSTRRQSGLGGSTGGFDDRFDFIMTSENMLTSADITYVPNSYQVYGNNGLLSCYNEAINDNDCGLASSTYSFAIRDALHNFSDHLPVTVSLSSNVTLLSTPENQIEPRKIVKSTLIDSRLTILNHDLSLANKKAILYNTLGQIVKTYKINSTQEQHLNLSNFESGIYFLRIKNTTLEPVKLIITN